MSAKVFWETLHILVKENGNPKAYYPREISNGYVRDTLNETIETQTVSLPIIRNDVSCMCKSFVYILTTTDTNTCVYFLLYFTTDPDMAQ